MKSRVVFSLFLAVFVASISAVSADEVLSTSKSAWAIFTHESGCKLSTVEFRAIKEETQEWRGARVDAWYNVFDTCKDKDAVVAYGGKDINFSVLTVASDLSSGALNTTVNVRDPQTGRTFTIGLPKIRLTATGSVRKITNKTPLGDYTEVFTQRSRPATAKGENGKLSINGSSLDFGRADNARLEDATEKLVEN